MSIEKFEKLGVDEETIAKYLQDGPMTGQFLNDQILDEQMGKAKTDKDKVKILFSYIHSKTTNPRFATKEYKAKHKFQRTAGEIWKDKQMTGCTDYALVFCTLARKYGLPTTFFETLEEGCYNDIKSGANVNKVSGHQFCECLIDGKWKLLDPTFSSAENNYDENNIRLTWFHLVAGKRNFIPVSRELDTGKRSNIKEHNNMLKNKVILANVKNQNGSFLDENERE